MSSGSVRTFRSQRTLPTSSTTQTDVSSTETSKPTKCAIAAAPSQMFEVRPIPDLIIVCEGAARSSLEGSGAAAAIHHLSTLSVSKAIIPLPARSGHAVYDHTTSGAQRFGRADLAGHDAVPVLEPAPGNPL